MRNIQYPTVSARKLPFLVEQSRQFDIGGVRYLALKTFEASIDCTYTV